MFVRSKFSVTRLPILLITFYSLAFSAQLIGQEQEESDDEGYGSSASLLEEVTVTARKREEDAQEVPIAISAYTGQQLEALKIRDLRGLSVAMPNVAMDDIGTIRGVANFSIRGLGINSSIPGIDPTVGVFIDGVYLTQNAGVVLDMFDIESIEVLRGPQGTLFGRNVTGGAVLVNTRKPTGEFELSLRGAIDGNSNGDGGTNYYLMGAVGGAVTDTLSARLSVYHNEDDGWFENLATGENFGEASTTIYRPSFVWEPSEDLRMTFRWEHFETDGQGPASQNHRNGRGVPGAFVQSFYPFAFERDSFDFAIDEPGSIDAEIDTINFRIDWNVGPGLLTNIYGYRDMYQTGYSDIDAQPVWIFHAGTIIDQDQWSNELRYNIPYGDGSNFTMGLYYLDSTVRYSEGRDLLGFATAGTPLEGFPAATQYGGGTLDLESKAGFMSADHALNNDWSVFAGARYTIENKDVAIATLTRNINNPCTISPSDAGYRICTPDFNDGDQWTAWSGKFGFTRHITNHKRLYAYWTQGHRSGGYNLRNTAIDTANFGPGPFDEETVTTFELGYKSEIGGLGRLNAAVFFTEVEDMQREINQSDPFSGVVQVIKNTADAQIPGFEIDSAFGVGDNTVILASLGWVNPLYTEVRFDLNGDGEINQFDKNLDLPRAAEWTYSIGVNHDWLLDSGSRFSFRVNYAYRDDSFYTDNNLGFLLDQEILDAGLDYITADGQWVFSLYGRNLLDSVNQGGDTQLPGSILGVPTGGTFSPLLKGRIVGFEVTWDFAQ
ncbi:MAG TPA: TonB-dependent receptor [Xanthomonadales bacterium]|nr:TonB-dependent receptor [Xanthomonadales bacterium]